MKKKSLILPLSILGLLAACTPGGNTSSSGESSSSEVASSSQSSSSQMEIEKTEMAYTYYDYGKGNISTIPSCPSIGSPKILVIPIWFSDSATYLPSEINKSNVLEDISSAFFGSEEETGWHSIRSYYAEESGNLLTFSGTVSSEWYEAPYPTSMVGSSAGMAYSMGIAFAATEWYFDNNPEEDRTSYDLDKDGYLDAVSFIYAAPDYRALGDTSLTNLWAYCNWMNSYVPGDVDNPNVGTYFWASYDFMYSADNVLERAGSSYSNGSSFGYSSDNPIDAHTYIHEFGHVLGLDDYYDVNGQYSPAAGFSMEDYMVGGHEPYSLMALGWANPYIPTESGSLTIGSFQSTHDFLLLTPEMNEYLSPFDEYLILELYTPNGLNELDSHNQYRGTYPIGPKDIGIRLWHIDARLIEVSANEDGTGFVFGKLTSNPYPEDKKIYKAFPNTYYKEGGSGNGYCSVLGQEYSDYNTLQLIRNDEEATYRPTEELKGSDLFKDGDSFSMNEFSSQFVKGDKLNSDTPLGWSFSVSINGEGENVTATIDLVKG